MLTAHTLIWQKNEQEMKTKIHAAFALIGASAALSVLPPAASAHEHTLGGLDLASYCEARGEKVSQPNPIVGPEAAERWACLSASKARHPINMQEACARQYPRRGAVAVVNNPDEAFSWRCVAGISLPTELHALSADSKELSVALAQERELCLVLRSEGFRCRASKDLANAHHFAIRLMKQANGAAKSLSALGTQAPAKQFGSIKLRVQSSTSMLLGSPYVQHPYQLHLSQQTAAELEQVSSTHPAQRQQLQQQLHQLEELTQLESSEKLIVQNVAEAVRGFRH